MAAIGNAKGGTGTPQTQGQGKGAGGNAMAQAGAGAKPPSPAAMQAQQRLMSAQALAQKGGPQAQQMLANQKRQAGIAGLQNQYQQQVNQANTQNKANDAWLANQTAEKNFAAGTGASSMEGLNKADFMAGGALSGANSMAAEDPDAIAAQQAADVANPQAAAARAAAAPTAPNADAQARMMSTLQSNNQRQPGAAQMPDARSYMSKIAAMGGPPAAGAGASAISALAGGGGGKGGGGGGKGGKGAGGQAVRQTSGRGMNNGGIVGLANGGRLGAVSGGGVTYGTPSAAPPPMAVATAPVAAAPVVAARPAVAAAPAWTPQAVGGAGGGGMFSGIASVPIVQPKAWSGPTTPQKLWEPPKAAVAPAGPAGLSNIDFNRALLFGGADTSKMTDRQYATYLSMRNQTSGGQSGGGGGRSHGDRGGYSR